MNDFIALLGITTWKPLLGVLLLPPVPLLVLVLLGTRLVLPRRGLGWLVVLTSVALLWLSTCSGSARLLSHWLLHPPGALPHEKIEALREAVRAKQPVAILVLGGGARRLAPEYGVGDLSPISLERLRYAVWLARQTGAPLAFSGGIGHGLREGETAPEAQLAARIAEQEFGRALKWTEDRSRDTRENAAYSVPLLKAQGIQRVVLVTHQAHMPRALRAMEQVAGGAINFEPAPVGVAQGSLDRLSAWLPSREGFAGVHVALHEAFGLLFGA